MKTRSTALLLFSLLMATGARAQQPTSETPKLAPDQVVDEAISRENALLITLQSSTPVVETYIQDMVPDNDFGAVPVADHYFLGKIDLANGLARTSYLPRKSDGPGRFDLFAKFLTIHYLPKGFAQMMLIDAGAFDRNHYDFQFVRREFLGDIRALVFAVTPLKGAGAGRFEGDIWIEDKGCNIVRFNGTYSGSSGGRMYLHFDSWRLNAGPDLWLPYEVYSEESSVSDALKIHTAHFKAITRFWSYTEPDPGDTTELTTLTVQMSDVQDKSVQATDPSPVENLRAWQRQTEDNILGRLEQAGLVSKAGGVDKVLDTVLNNLAVTNNLNILPTVRARVLLTTPLESFTIGHTIVISRGMLDTLPDEASLAAVLSHELAHIALGHATPTDFAFSDRLRFDDSRIVERFKLTRTPAEEDAANERAVQLLLQSPYKDKLGEAGLFLKALSSEANRLPSLIRPLFGDKLVQGPTVLRMSELLDDAPQLQTARVDQVAALPLGSRTKLDPWTDDLEMVTMHNVPLGSASEKMPFEITPIFLHLTYADGRPTQSMTTESAYTGK